MVLGKLDIQVQKYEFEPLPYTIYRTTQNGEHMRWKLKLWEENIEKTFHDTASGKNFLDMTTKAQAIETEINWTTSKF